MNATFLVFAPVPDFAIFKRRSLRLKEMNQEYSFAVLNAKETARLCDETRKSLGRQCRTLRRLIKDPASDPNNCLSSMAASLQKQYRHSMVLSIEINQQLAKQAHLLANEPAGIVKLWEATRRLTETFQKVAGLLKAVENKNG